MQSFKHISVASTEAIDYIKRRRSGEEKSLQVSQKKLNSVLLKGIPWNRIFTIGGRSGSGKSTIVEQWKRDLVDLNKDQPLEILSFEYEMLAVDQMIRSLAAKTHTSSEHIQSADEDPVTDKEMDLYKEVASEITEAPIFYVDDSGTVEDMKNTIHNFVLQRDLKEKGKGLVVTIDHIILTKGKYNDNEKKIIDDLYKMLLEVKKNLASNGIRVLFICISQLNRDIESSERKQPDLQYPVASDLFAASSVYHASDYVLITHNPSTIPGIYAYGPAWDEYPNGLPLRCEKTNRAMIYWHLIKNRFGKNRIMIMRENFFTSSIEDMEKEMEKA